MSNELRETMANLAHSQWSGWMEYLFGKCTFNLDGSATIPAEFVARWQRQAKVPYAELSESEQNSDRTEADKFLATIKDGWYQAFHKAEGETAEQYNQQTCSLADREGNQTCPICYFSRRMKIHLGIEPGEE